MPVHAVLFCHCETVTVIVAYESRLLCNVCVVSPDC